MAKVEHLFPSVFWKPIPHDFMISCGFEDIPIAFPMAHLLWLPIAHLPAQVSPSRDLNPGLLSDPPPRRVVCDPTMGYLVDHPTNRK